MDCGIVGGFDSRPRGTIPRRPGQGNDRTPGPESRTVAGRAPHESEGR